MPGPFARISVEEHDYDAVRNIETDGNLYNRPKDPPGQRSHYIQSGNPEAEVYRVTTFNKFPNHVPVDPMQLAKHGFLFTGYKDRVKCFSCCLCVQDWMSEDNPKSSKWHFEDCPLLNGRESRNIPIAKLIRRPLEFVMESSQSGVSSDSGYGALDFKVYSNSQSSQSPPQLTNGSVSNITSGLQGVNLEDSTKPKAYQTAQVKVPLGPHVIKGLDVARIHNENFNKLLLTLDICTEEGRRKSFELAIEPNAHFKSLNHNMLARSGFYYLGDMDRTQCFSCSGILRNWRTTDIADNEHKRHFPNCKLINNNEPRNVPIIQLGTPPNPNPEEQVRLDELFPCLNPINPNMSSYENRLRSFNANWDRTKINAPVELIAEAGFFYLGSRDRAKCFYCNGGLQNWDVNDEPWTEHAKWFPGCEFILKSKGIEFVREMFVKHPNMQRLKIRNERREYHPSFQTQSCPTPTTNARTVVHRQTQSAGAVLLQGMSPINSMMQADDLVPNPPNVVPAVNQMELNANEIEKFRNQAKRMGYSDDQINTVIQNRGNNGTSDLQQMIEELINIQPSSTNNGNTSENIEMVNVPENANSERMPTTNQQQSNTAPKRNNPAPPSSNDHNKRAKKDEAICQELFDLEKERMCRKCASNPADAVLIPCGHLSFCSDCVHTGDRCQLCRRKIDQVIKVFVA